MADNATRAPSYSSSFGHAMEYGGSGSPRRETLRESKGAYEQGGKYVIYTCDSCLAAVDKAHPDASHFLLVRAYTYRAMNADGEEAGDVWAASAITQAPNAVHHLNAILNYFAASKDPHAAMRHERIRSAAVEIARLAGLTMKWNASGKKFEE